MEDQSDYDHAVKSILLEKNKAGLSVPNGKYYFDLLPVINKSDKFGKWSLDPMFGMLKVFVKTPNETSFPSAFKLNEVILNYFFLDFLIISDYFKECVYFTQGLYN